MTRNLRLLNEAGNAPREGHMHTAEPRIGIVVVAYNASSTLLATERPPKPWRHGL